MEAFHCCKSFLFIGPTGDKPGQQRGLDCLGKGTVPTPQDHLWKSGLLGSQSPTDQDHAGLFSHLLCFLHQMPSGSFSMLRRPRCCGSFARCLGFQRREGRSHSLPKEASVAGSPDFPQSSSEPSAGMPQLERAQSCLKS